MSYVDGFVLPCPTANLAAYKKLARKACKVWLEHGALEYFEAVGDDFSGQGTLPFTRLAKAKPDETVVFAWIRYRSRAHRDQVNAKVMQDPRLSDMCTKEMPFDIKRMASSGFKVLVGGRAVG